MRLAFPVFVLVIALVLAIALRIAVPQAQNPGIEILAVSSPTTVRAGEGYSAYGGLSFPEGRYEKRFRVCGPDGCTTGGYGAITGPGEWWGFLGSFNPAVPGRYEAMLLMFDYGGIGVWRTVGRYAWSVDAR